MITDIDSIGIVTPVAFKDMLATGNVESASIQVSEKGLIMGSPQKTEFKVR